MTLKRKQEKIVDYILGLSYKEKLVEIEWLVKNSIINDDDVIDCYDYVFMDENDNVVFEED